MDQIKIGKFIAERRKKQDLTQMQNMSASPSVCLAPIARNRPSTKRPFIRLKMRNV